MTDRENGPSAVTFTVAIKWVGYVTLPSDVDAPSISIYRSTLSALVIHYMDWETWTCRVANATLAERTGLNPRSVQRAMAALDAAGVIARVDDRPGKSNEIRLNVEALRAMADVGKETSRSAAQTRGKAKADRASTTTQTHDSQSGVTQSHGGGDSESWVGVTDSHGGGDSQSYVPVCSSVHNQSLSEPPYPPEGGEGNQEHQGMKHDDDLGAYTAAFRAEWDEAADTFYPGQRSQLWDGGKNFISPREAERQAHIFEHGKYLPQMLALYVAACEANDRSFGQRDFSSQTIVNQLRAWAERGTVPFWAKASKGARVEAVELTPSEDCINIGCVDGGATPAASDDHIEWD